MKRDLLFVHRFFGDRKSFASFRLGELSSLATLSGVDSLIHQEYNETSPFVFSTIEGSEESIRRFFTLVHDRSVLLRGVYEVWGSGANLEACVESTKSQYEPYYRAIESETPGFTFSTQIHAFGIDYTPFEQKQIRDLFFFLPFYGPVDLKTPQQNFWIYCSAKPGEHGSAVAAASPSQSRLYSPRIERFLFCRQLVQCTTFYTRYALQSRRYIGPTSIPADLSFLYATQVLADKGKLIFDPFAGTGSLLIGCAVFGAQVLGSDLDWKVLHGKMKKAKYTIQDNFRQYNLPLPDLICTDQSVFQWRSPEFLDGIVCDPPYGIRAGARKSGRKNGNLPQADVERERAEEEQRRKEAESAASGSHLKPVEEALCSTFPEHIPPSQVYEVEDVIADMLDSSARSLKVGGRLVYLLPSTDDLLDSELPQHPLMRLVDSAEQKLRGNFSRRLVTMEKIAPWEENNPAKKFQRRKPGEPAPKYSQLKQAILEGMQELLDSVKEVTVGGKKTDKTKKEEKEQQKNAEAEADKKQEDAEVSESDSQSQAAEEDDVKDSANPLANMSKRSQKRLMRIAAKREIIAKAKAGVRDSPFQARPKLPQRESARPIDESSGSQGEKKRKVILDRTNKQTQNQDENKKSDTDTVDTVMK